MRINEIFESIQGEGKFAGYPTLFIRLSGCTRSCSFCDTKYHIDENEVSYDYILNKIRESKTNIVVWTGGEPLLQFNEIKDIIELTRDKEHHLETNGDLIKDKLYELSLRFRYISISPKDKKVAKQIKEELDKDLKYNYFSSSKALYDKVDIKVVTDLKLNKNLIPYATMLMPLTVNDTEEFYGINVLRTNLNKKNEPVTNNRLIQQNVWVYCVKNNIRYSPRLHVEVFGINKRGI